MDEVTSRNDGERGSDMATKRRGYMWRKRRLPRVRPGAVVIAVAVIAVLLW